MKRLAGKKAQVSVISFWILTILTILAVSIAHRVSFGLKLSQYHKDKLKASYLAKAGVNRAIAEIINDKTPGYDSLADNWAENEEVFKKIVLSENQNEFAAVSYVAKEGKEEQIKYGVQDQERKININTASKELLTSLFELSSISDAENKASYTLIWRGDIEDDKKNYENLGLKCKSNKFVNIEELTLVKDISMEEFQKLKDMITVHSDGPVNINTVTPIALNLLTRAIAKKFSIEQNFSESVANKIIELRDKNGYFKEKNDISIMLTGDDETNIFNNLIDSVIFQSNNFSIEVCGFVGKIKSKITAVYNRKDNNILYWHES